MFLCPQEYFVDYLGLRAVIPGLSVRIGKATVLAVLLKTRSLKEQRCRYRVSTKPAVSLSRDRDDLKMQRAVNPTSAEIWAAARFPMLAPAFLKVSGNHESQTSQWAVRERCSGARSFVNAAVSPSTSTSCCLYVVRGLSLWEAELGCPAWCLRLIRTGASKLTPAATLTRLGPNSKFTHCFNPMSFHVCVLDFLLTHSKGRFILRVCL